MSMKLFGKEVRPMLPKIKSKELNAGDQSFIMTFQEGRKIYGSVYFEHRHIPIDHFYIHDIEVKSKYRGLSTEKVSGVGGSILAHIELFLRRRSRSGKSCVVVLADALEIPEFKNSDDVLGMYEKHGYISIGTEVLYRSPKKISSGNLKKLKAYYT